MTREALQQALEFCEFLWRDVAMSEYAEEYRNRVEDALRAALREPEPVNQCGETCERARLCAACAGELAKPELEVYHGWVTREVLFDNGEPIGHREPQREPVAWMYEFWADRGHSGLAFEPQEYADNVPLYTHPVPSRAQMMRDAGYTRQETTREFINRNREPDSE